ncbi:nuclear transport factor 2 family protein [Streptomyces sp. NPDC021093]|uniref:nuclear transport factor 2 family protein n=1 Tax=Streptomyces sp. NPDC021093 TaxID=3365112 RepID=UPI0037926BFC
MSDTRKLIERYLEIWNETDPVARRAAIEEVWTEDAVYVDPLVAAEGRPAIDAAVQGVQEQFPGLLFTLSGEVDAHHLARFSWDLGPHAGEALAVGFDVAVLTDDAQQIRTVHGFLDKVPGA